MKKVNCWSLILAAALVASLLQFDPVLRAQTQSQNPPDSARQQPSQNPPDSTQEQPGDQQQQPAPAQQTFNGQIAKSGDMLVLKDPASNMAYELDDQEKAKAYEGKSVKVTGTLDAESNMIHVQDIQPSGS